MSRRPTLIRDPRAVPVAGADLHLPALAGERLTPARLKARFASPPVWQPEFRGDGGGPLSDRAPAAAAVLVALVVHEDGLRVLLTRRTDHLRDHAGQISFPGGRVDPGEVDPVVTALREAREEIGLDDRHIEVIGALPAYTTVTSYVVTPVVALVHRPFELQIDGGEVAEAFEVPLEFLMTPAHHQIHLFDTPTERRQFLSMPWRGPSAEGDEREYFIWGATAAMLRNLYRFLSA
ncbi:CoA pyrophosphatase [uncultured Sphaerotilus sp.]|uniref:NUDIX hydrolase n=1 Tax=uncultured Sphaerotilus sp. TaxID=474984 RepID=UPI0030CA4F6A